MSALKSKRKPRHLNPDRALSPGLLARNYLSSFRSRQTGPVIEIPRSKESRDPVTVADPLGAQRPSHTEVLLHD